MPPQFVTDLGAQVTEAEKRLVSSDLSWLDACTCSQFALNEFFVAAGQTIDPDVLEAARRCPARRQEIIFAYGRDVRAGYFGALSPGQRRTMTLEQALKFAARQAAERR